MSELIRIPESGIFETPRATYYVQPLELRYKRLVIFQNWRPKIMYGMTISQAVEFLREIYRDLKQPKHDGVLAAWTELVEKVGRFLEATKFKTGDDALDKSYDDLLMFSALYITDKNEDLNEFDERYALEKIEDWKKHVYVDDFFFQAQKRISMYLQQSVDSIQKISHNQKR